MDGVILASAGSRHVKYKAIDIKELKMFGGNKVTIEKVLWEKIKKYASIAGYSSPEEFVLYALEREMAILEEADSDEEILKKLNHVNRRWLGRPNWCRPVRRFAASFGSSPSAGSRSGKRSGQR